jgi:hypothetical protein
LEDSVADDMRAPERAAPAGAWGLNALPPHAREATIKKCAMGIANDVGRESTQMIQHGGDRSHLRTRSVHLRLVATTPDTVQEVVQVRLAAAVHDVCARRGSPGLGAELCAELIQTEREDGAAQPSSSAPSLPEGALASLWIRPYHVVLAAQLERWARTGEHPFSDTQPLEGLQAMDGRGSIDSTVVLPASRALAATAPGILEALGAWEVLRLLGMRRTRLSLPRAPPSLAQLRASFNVLWRAGNQLSVGARALSKHWHRGSFWTAEWRGSEAEKSRIASAALERVLGHAVWANCHRLPVAGTAPGDNDVFELRLPSGHGARWSADGTAFRGFLEPQAWDEARRIAAPPERRWATQTATVSACGAGGRDDGHALDASPGNNESGVQSNCKPQGQTDSLAI